MPWELFWPPLGGENPALAGFFADRGGRNCDRAPPMACFGGFWGFFGGLSGNPSNFGQKSLLFGSFFAKNLHTSRQNSNLFWLGSSRCYHLLHIKCSLQHITSTNKNTGWVKILVGFWQKLPTAAGELALPKNSARPKMAIFGPFLPNSCHLVLQVTAIGRKPQKRPKNGPFLAPGFGGFWLPALGFGSKTSPKKPPKPRKR
mgnify:CR=1 FL=1